MFNAHCKAQLRAFVSSFKEIVPGSFERGIPKAKPKIFDAGRKAQLRTWFHPSRKNGPAGR